MSTYRGVFNVKVRVGAFNQEKALVGIFPVIIKLHIIFGNIRLQLYPRPTVWRWFWSAMTAWFSCRSGSWRWRAGRRGWCTWRRSTSTSCKSENIKCKISERSILSLSISIQQTCPTWLMSRLVEKKTFNVKASKYLDMHYFLYLNFTHFLTLSKNTKGR